jgi:hypothetical protein
VYGQNPLSLLDLIPLPISQYFNGDAEEKAKQLKKLHEQVCDKIERKNQKYQTQANKHYKYIKFK